MVLTMASYRDQTNSQSVQDPGAPKECRSERVQGREGGRQGERKEGQSLLTSDTLYVQDARYMSGLCSTPETTALRSGRIRVAYLL